MDEKALAFLDQFHTAAMIALRKDGTPHVARVAVGVVDGKLWSSGTQERLRTKFLRRDPRSTLFVFGSGPAPARWLALECTVRILEGPDVPDLSLRFFRILQAGVPKEREDSVLWYGQEKTAEEFVQTMREERRLIYEFEPHRVYGTY